MRIRDQGGFIALLFIINSLAFAAPSAQVQTTTLSTQSPPSTLWLSNEMGHGFVAGAQQVGISLALGFGLRVDDGAHDLAMAQLRYGWVITDVLARDKFYAGNFEAGAEVFGGAQYRPDTAYIVGGAPIMRYNFVTGSRWVPFVEVGFGAVYTDIKGKELSSNLQFKSEAGVGAHYFWSRNKALTFQYDFFHLSNGGRERPNGGVNINLLSLGVSVFF